MPKNEVVISKENELEDFKIDLKPQIPQFPEVELSKLNMKYPLIPPYAFAHIFWDFQNKELVYFVEEPGLNPEELRILDVLEEGIRELINISFLAVKDGDTVIKYLEKNIRVLLRELKLEITNDSYQKIMYFIYRDFVGLGKIEPFLCDYFIEDIECNGVNFPIYIVHRKYRNLRTNITYHNADKLATFVERLAQKCGHYISYATPLLDGSLPDGSIDYNEPIILKENGFIKIRKIGKLIDKYYKERESNKPIEVKDIEVPAFDPNTLKIQWKKVDYVYRHKINEKLLSLKLETGRKLNLTGNHSIFILRKEGLKSERTSNIKIGDYVAIPLKIPDGNYINEINLAAALAHRKFSHKLVLENIPYSLFMEKSSEIKGYLNKNYKCPYEAYYELRTKRILPLDLYRLLTEEQLRQASIKTTSTVTCPTFLKVNKELMVLLGYYVAEGWLSKPEKHHNYDITFCLHKDETEYHQEIIQAFRRLFDQNVYIEPIVNNAVKLKCNSYIIWHIFKYVLRVGKYAKHKKIPALVFNVRNELKEEFIRTYKNGDYGSSASERLLSDLLYIHLFKNKIISYYDRQRTLILDNRVVKAREFYTNNLVREQTDYFKMLPVELFNPLKNTHGNLSNKRISRKRLKLILNEIRYERFRNLDEVSNIKFLKEWQKRGFLEGKNLTSKGRELIKEVEIVNKLIDSDLAFIKVKEINKINSSSDFVYDVSVKDCENFIGGYGGICCHNSRVNATFTEDITSRGPSFTVRKFTSKPWPPSKLMQLNTISPEMLAYLWMLIEYEANIMVIGGTASGKTTLLNALAYFIPPQARIVSIEDTRELNIQHSNWLPSVAREGVGLTNLVGQKYGDVSLFDLLKESFRQRPDYVIVGEVRGKEAYVLFQGMASGHPSLGTMHANSVDTMLRRLETPPINLSSSLVEILDVVVVMTQTKIKGKEVRRVTEINEIISVKEGQGAQIHTPFAWNPITDGFTFNNQSYVFNKFFLHQGISQAELFKELEIRTKLLINLFKYGIFDFLEFRNIINEYYKDPMAILKRFNVR